MVLLQRQKEELNKAIADYLSCNGYEATLKAFKEEAEISEVEAKFADLLEKKWVSVIRLQKKVVDLETKLGETKKECEALTVAVAQGGGKGGGSSSALGSLMERPGGEKKSGAAADWIPRPPYRHALLGHRSPVTRVKFHPVFALLVSASEDATLRVWDYESGEFEHVLRGHTDSVQDVAFDGTGRLLASCSADMLIKIWDLSAYTCVKTLAGHDHNVCCVEFFPPPNASDFLVSASRDHTVKVWEVGTGYCVRTVIAHGDWVRQVRVSGDGALLATCSNDKAVKVWPLEVGSSQWVPKEPRWVLGAHEHVVECVAWAPSAAGRALSGGGDEGGGHWLASGGRDRTIFVWDADRGMKVFALVGHDNWVRQLAFHPHGKHLLSASDDKTVLVWDLGQRRALKTLEAHAHFVTTLDIHPGGRPFVATGSVDQSVRVWDCR